MKQYSYFDKTDLNPDKIFNELSPIQFCYEFSLFYKTYHKAEIKILYSESLDAYIPIRYYSVKVFRFAQILHAPICNNVELAATEQQLFFDELINWHHANQLCQRFTQPHPYGILKAVPQGALACVFGTYITDLTKYNEEELLHSFDTKYRKAVNHSDKNGAVVRFGWECFDDFYQLYQSTTSRAGIHCDSVDYFKTLHQCLSDKHVCIGVVYDNEQPIGSICIIYTKYAALCTHAGSGGESKLYGAVKLLHYAAMKELKQKGVRLYDLVGVRINSRNEALEGIFRFKKGFGGELKEGYLWKTDIAPLKTKVFDMMMRIRYSDKKNYRDIIDEETN